MPRTTLVGRWTVTVAASLAQNATVTEGVIIEITESTIKLGSLETPIALNATKLSGSFTYTPEGSTVSRQGHLHCFPTSPKATIIGGSTEGDPETVAVWGGDETDPGPLP